MSRPDETNPPAREPAGDPARPSLEDRLLALLRQPDYSPMRVEQLGDTLKLDAREAKKLRPLIHHLLNQGLVAKVKQDQYVIPHDADLGTGVIKFRPSGAALFFPEKADGTPVGGEPWHIPAEDTGTALHADRVLVRENKRPKPWRVEAARGAGPPRLGRVIRILQRSTETLPGTLRRDHQFWHVIPDDPRIVQNILVADPAKVSVFPPPKPGDKVIVRLQEWTQRHLNPVGEIIENLGPTHSPGAEFKAVLHKYKLHPEFPEAVVHEVAALPTEVRPRDRTGREDIRHLLTFTIDPDDAKDFDDALSLEPLPNGEWRIGVHIADVGAYVRTGTALDRDARGRGNSTYLVGCVIPMLPHALSNGLCSLVEAKDRLTKSVFFTFTAAGRIRHTHYANTVICSRKRMTYRQAYAMLKEDDLEIIRALPLPAAHSTGATGRALAELTDAELMELRDATRTLWGFAAQLRHARMEKGSLDLDFPEVKIFVDADGYADRLEVIKNDESHQLIEEYMLMANEAVARALHEVNLPFLSRVHDQPDPEKLNELRDHLATFGVVAGDLTQRREVVRLLEKIKGHPQGYALKTQFLRSLKQACYRASVDGHYGLFKKFYAHFTSPIRRYSDLVVHRIFDAFLARQGHTSGAAVTRYDQAELHQLGRHLSLTERNSTDAERETVKLKLLEFFEREAKREPRLPFRARITDVRNHGFFVELSESMAYGFVPFSSIADDLYFVSGDGLEASGRRTKRRFALGSEILVEVLRVDRFKRQIDFRVVAEGGSAAKRPGGPPSSRPSAPPRRQGPRPAAPQRSQQQPREGQRNRDGGRNRQRRRR